MKDLSATSVAQNRNMATDRAQSQNLGTRPKLGHYVRLQGGEKRVFCEYCEWLIADSEGCGCGIDMVDGASETLDLTLFKRNMIEFSFNVIGR